MMSFDWNRSIRDLLAVRRPLARVIHVRLHCSRIYLQDAWWMFRSCIRQAAKGIGLLLGWTPKVKTEAK